MSADGLWAAYLRRSEIGTAEALSTWPLSACHKVVPHRRLLIRAFASLFSSDEGAQIRISKSLKVCANKLSSSSGKTPVH